MFLCSLYVGTTSEIIADPFCFWFVGRSSVSAWVLSNAGAEKEWRGLVYARKRRALRVDLHFSFSGEV